MVPQISLPPLPLQPQQPMLVFTIQAFITTTTLPPFSSTVKTALLPVCLEAPAEVVVESIITITVTIRAPVLGPKRVHPPVQLE